MTWVSRLSRASLCLETAPDSSIREVSLEPSKPQEERTQLSQEIKKGHVETEELYPAPLI